MRLSALSRQLDSKASDWLMHSEIPSASSVPRVNWPVPPFLQLGFTIVSNKHLLFTPALSMPWQSTQSATVRSLERVTAAGMASMAGETGETGVFRTRVSRFLHRHETAHPRYRQRRLGWQMPAAGIRCARARGAARPGGRYAVGR